MKTAIIIAAAVFALSATAHAQTIDCNNNWLAYKKLQQHRTNGACQEKSGLEGRDQTKAETDRAKANRERNLANR